MFKNVNGWQSSANQWLVHNEGELSYLLIIDLFLFRVRWNVHIRYDV